MSVQRLQRNVATAIAMIALCIPCIWGQSVGGQDGLNEPFESENSRRFSSAATPPQLIVDGDVQLRVEANASSARIAEPIEVTLIFEAPLGTRATLPMTAANLGDFEVMERQVVEGLPIDGRPERRSWTCRLTLESLDAGELLIPSLEVIYRLPGDEGNRSEQTAIRSLAFPVEITSVVDADHDPKDFRDIKDSVAALEQATHRTSFVWWAIAGLLGASIMLGLLFWLRRDRTPIPIQWASREVDRVETQAKSNQLGTLEGYTELSLILRNYLEQELRVPASSQSVEELRVELSDQSIPTAITQRLTQFLTESDEIRFSGAGISASDQLTAPIGTVRELIREVDAARRADTGRSD